MYLITQNPFLINSKIRFVDYSIYSQFTCIMIIISTFGSLQNHVALMLSFVDPISRIVGLREFIGTTGNLNHSGLHFHLLSQVSALTSYEFVFFPRAAHQRPLTR